MCAAPAGDPVVAAEVVADEAASPRGHAGDWRANLPRMTERQQIRALCGGGSLSYSPPPVAVLQKRPRRKTDKKKEEKPDKKKKKKSKSREEDGIFDDVDCVLDQVSLSAFGRCFAHGKQRQEDGDVQYLVQWKTVSKDQAWVVR
eukprot:TRINITY_DN2451_c0_g1_i2.p3 TRINITY_DN2451_c0_g1~~TRINITY_DN2451_c0_g1_i2.p3  ORF type:complete len:145 (+),score=32.46 TRINITY_DN2451_c0_g1_i2:68-502(+)